VANARGSAWLTDAARRSISGRKPVPTSVVSQGAIESRAEKPALLKDQSSVAAMQAA
jgi:hypothetical protein